MEFPLSFVVCVCICMCVCMNVCVRVSVCAVYVCKEYVCVYLSERVRDTLETLYSLTLQQWYPGWFAA